MPSGEKLEMKRGGDTWRMLWKVGFREAASTSKLESVWCAGNATSSRVRGSHLMSLRGLQECSRLGFGISQVGAVWVEFGLVLVFLSWRITKIVCSQARFRRFARSLGVEFGGWSSSIGWCTRICGLEFDILGFEIVFSGYGRNLRFFFLSLFLCERERERERGAQFLGCMGISCNRIFGWWFFLLTQYWCSGRFQKFLDFGSRSAIAAYLPPPPILQSLRSWVSKFLEI